MERSTGNAIAAWVQSDGVANSVYVSFYNATTRAWSTPVQIDNSANPVATTANTLRVAMAGGRAAVAWLQPSVANGPNDLLVASYDGASWTDPAAVEQLAAVPSQPSLAIDATGIVSMMWQQSDGI